MNKTHIKLKKCPLQKTLESIGGKWKILVLFNIYHTEKIRFNALHKQIPGISQKVLTAQLRELESDGFLIREIYPEVPPRVEYSLNEKGLSLFPVLDSLAKWSGENHC